MNKIYYNSNSKIGRQTLAYLESSYKDLLAIDSAKTNITGTQWIEICEGLSCHVSDLIDKEHPAFTNHYKVETELSEEDWLKILYKHPEVLAYPICILGEKFYRIINYSEIQRKLAPNSKGLDEQNPEIPQ